MTFFNTIRVIGSLRLKLARQGGFALISAIFLLVTLAALGVVMVILMTSQQSASGMDVMGSRAYQAARAGAEWALYNRLNPQVGAPTTAPAYCPSSPSAVNTVTNNLTLPAGTTLSSFTVTVQCVATPNIITANPPIIVRTITAWACNQPVAKACPGTPGTDYVQREVQVSTQEIF